MLFYINIIFIFININISVVIIFIVISPILITPNGPFHIKINFSIGIEVLARSVHIAGCGGDKRSIANVYNQISPSPLLLIHTNQYHPNKTGVVEV